MELHCAYQQYHWGKQGAESTVAQLAAAANKTVTIDDAAHYAELWMGTHPNGPAVLADSGKTLGEWISEHPESLGQKVLDKFGTQLPYLLKVLSVNTALSIQAHPTKTHAETLHADRPDLYKDDNHKPEMALALTPFEALCGFRPIKEIQNFLREVPELAAAVGAEHVTQLLNTSAEATDVRDRLRACVNALMTRAQEDISRHLQSLVLRLQALGVDSSGAMPARLLLRLHDQYPGDVGVFWCLLLNYITLQPGQALFLGPNEPHAYLYGDCVECMACSDNVVRAGLTPKFKDVPTLVQMLSYESAPASRKLFPPSGPAEVQVFDPPVPDFAVAKISFRPEAAGVEYAVPVRAGASVLLVIRGAATHGATVVQRGTVLFVPADQTITLQLTTAEDVLMYQAFCAL